MTDTIILSIDSLRQDCFISSHFSETWPMFQKEFVTFENNYANGVATPFSFPAIVTGHPARADGSLSADTPTFAELYDGYTWGLSNNPHLRRERNYNRGFSFFTDDLTELRNSVVSERPIDNDYSFVQRIKRVGGKSNTLHKLYDRFLRTPSFEEPRNRAEFVVEEIQNAMTDREGLFWGHFMDPHYKFQPGKVPDKETSTKYSKKEIWHMNKRFKRGEADSEDLKCLFKLYKDQIKYLDRCLSEFFTYLKKNNRWEDSLIVVLSDHGESFGEEGVFNHQWDADPIDPLIKTPLLVKFPHGKSAGEKLEHLTSNADLIATLAAEFNWEIEFPQGTKPLLEPGSRIVISKSNTSVRVITENGSKICRRDGTSATQWGSIDESTRLILERQDIPYIETLIGDIPGVDEMKKVEQRLESLGYK